MGGEATDRERGTFQEIGRPPASGAESETPLAIEQQLDQGDRIHPQAAVPEPEVVRQLGLSSGEGGSRSHQVPNCFVDVHCLPV